MRSSDPLRGIVMLLAAAFALWKGWQIHHGNRAVLAFSLAAVAIGMAVWHFTRKPAKPKS